MPHNFADPAGAVCLKTNPTGADDDEAVQQASRHDLARALAPRYVHASRREKGRILDEFCAITGYTRKHALVLLSYPPAEQNIAARRGRPPSYGPDEVALLRVCWTATDGICSKRLAPFLPELLERLRSWHALHHVSRETIQRVARMSPGSEGRGVKTCGSTPWARSSTTVSDPEPTAASATSSAGLPMKATVLPTVT